MSTELPNNFKISYFDIHPWNVVSTVDQLQFEILFLRQSNF